MKKKLFFCLVILIFLLPIFSAVEINMNSNFSKGETFLAKVSGNFLEPLYKEDIFFYRQGHIKVPMEYNILQIDNDYYIYALLTNKLADDYTFSIEGATYMQGDRVSQDKITKNFVILNKTADFSVNPGFILTATDFVIKIQNLQNKNISVRIFLNSTNLFVENLHSNILNLKPDEIVEVKFGLGNETLFKPIIFSTENQSYSLPVYAFVPIYEKKNFQEIQQTEQIEKNIEIINKSSVNKTKENVNISKQNKAENKTIIQKATTKTCSQLNGSVCETNQTCEGNSEYARDAVCCLGNCKDIKAKNTGKIIGWLMIFVILITILWFFRKKSKIKEKVNLLKIAKGRK